MMNIMMTLFDQEYVTRMYGIEQRNVERLNSIRNLMSKLKKRVYQMRWYFEKYRRKNSQYT